MKPLPTAAPAQALQWLDHHTAGEPDTDHRIWLQRPSQQRYPQVEHFRVATLAGIAAKARPGFAELWQRLTGDQPTLFPAGDLDTSQPASQTTAQQPPHPEVASTSS